MITSSQLSLSQRIVSVDEIPVTVSHLSYPRGTQVDPDGTIHGDADWALATEDGRGYIAEWHAGEETGEAVYFETYGPEGRRSHGWVDSVSRKIVQTG